MMKVVSLSGALRVKYNKLDPIILYYTRELADHVPVPDRLLKGGVRVKGLLTDDAADFATVQVEGLDSDFCHSVFSLSWLCIFLFSRWVFSPRRRRL